MKKFLLLVAGVAMAMTAKAFDFCYHGTPINNGDRINITEYWEQDNWYFNPHLTLESATVGNAAVTISNFTSTQSPDLKLDEDGFEYVTGIAKPQISICSFGNCELLTPGMSSTKGGQLSANTPEDLLIELCYELGLDETGIDNMTIHASFDVTATVNGESKKATFYVDHESASVAGINADSNAPVQYFDLQGRSITEPANGIFIKRQGNKVTKVVR